MLIPEKKPINISEKKEKRRRETIKPRKRKFILLFFNGFSQYRLRIRLWRCLDLFGRTSRVTFECLHFDEYDGEVEVVEEKVDIFLMKKLMIKANLTHGFCCQVICDCRSLHSKGSCENCAWLTLKAVHG